MELNQKLNQKLLETARKYIGVKETGGAQWHTSIILEWFKAAGAAWIRDDEQAWCSAFVCGVAREAGAFNRKTVRAQEWLTCPPPNVVTHNPEAAMPGDVVVMNRGKNLFHVAFLAAPIDFARGQFSALGGNQGNAVNIRPKALSLFVGSVRLATATTP